jgi:hypothetical protein
MQRQSDYGVVAVWAALVGLFIMALCFIKVPPGLGERRVSFQPLVLPQITLSSIGLPLGKNNLKLR